MSGKNCPPKGGKAMPFAPKGEKPKAPKGGKKGK